MLNSNYSNRKLMWIQGNLLNIITFTINRLLKSIYQGGLSSKKNTAFRFVHSNPTAIEDGKIKKYNEKMTKVDIKIT